MHPERLRALVEQNRHAGPLGCQMEVSGLASGRFRPFATVAEGDLPSVDVRAVLTLARANG